MHDAVIVGVLQRQRKLDRDVRDFAPVEPPAGLELVFQADAVDQLHGIEQHAVLLAVAVQADDAFVPQRFERFDLGFEPFAKSLGLGQVRRQRLDRHALAGFGIGRRVHRAHAAFAERLVDFVGAEVRELHGRAAGEEVQKDQLARTFHRNIGESRKPGSERPAAAADATCWQIERA